MPERVLIVDFVVHARHRLEEFGDLRKARDVDALHELILIGIVVVRELDLLFARDYVVDAILHDFKESLRLSSHLRDSVYHESGWILKDYGHVIR
jgi:hypothetical protein